MSMYIYTFTNISIQIQYRQTVHFCFVSRRRGRESGENLTLTLDDRMPFLIYFSSDEFGHGKGFSLSYQYYEQQAEQGSE